MNKFMKMMLVSTCCCGLTTLQGCFGWRASTDAMQADGAESQVERQDPESDSRRPMKIDSRVSNETVPQTYKNRVQRTYSVSNNTKSVTATLSSKSDQEPWIVVKELEIREVFDTKKPSKGYCTICRDSDGDGVFEDIEHCTRHSPLYMGDATVAEYMEVKPQIPFDKGELVHVWDYVVAAEDWNAFETLLQKYRKAQMQKESTK